ncbi:MAG: hypothetical protein E6J42_12665 [Chloroflexi bacterium]|nr:MAG: hypothetical protein E6J42_12665 [Chloroflexota bacterium]
MNEHFWASIYDGWQNQILLTQGSSIDFYPDLRLCGCTANGVAAGMSGYVKKGGGAEADVTLTLTYPQ